MSETIVNVENINRVIDAIRADKGKHFRMRDWVQAADTGRRVLGWVECNTALCLGGWANTLAAADAGVDYKKLTDDAFYNLFANSETAQEFYGIHYDQRGQLFGMSEVDGVFDLSAFDVLAPEKRAAIAIRVLEILRDTGQVDWRTALVENGVDLGDGDTDA